MYDFKRLAEKWPSQVVARSEVRLFTGGIISSKSLANAESLGTGPQSHRYGKKVFYDIDDLVTWLQARQGVNR